MSSIYGFDLPPPPILLSELYPSTGTEEETSSQPKRQRSAVYDDYPPPPVFIHYSPDFSQSIFLPYPPHHFDYPPTPHIISQFDPEPYFPQTLCPTPTYPAPPLAESSNAPSSSNEVAAPTVTRRSTRSTRGVHLRTNGLVIGAESILVPEWRFRLPLTLQLRDRAQTVYNALFSKLEATDLNELHNSSQMISTPSNKAAIKNYAKAITKDGVPDGLVVAKINDAIGHGVFATKTFQYGDFIGIYSGKLRVGALTSGNQSTFENNDYAYNLLCSTNFTQEELKRWLGTESNHDNIEAVVVQIDAQNEGNFTRYINHTSSRASNCATRRCDIEGVVQPIIIATKKINPGEQLLWDYGTDYWGEKDGQPNINTPTTFIFDVKSYKEQTSQWQAVVTRTQRAKRGRA